jgi:hypothetical protein
MKTWFLKLHPFHKIGLIWIPLFCYALYEVLRAEQIYGMTINVWIRMSLLGKLCAVVCFLAPFVAIVWAIVENVKKGKR